MKYGRWVIRSKEKRSDSDLFTLSILFLAGLSYIVCGFSGWAIDNYPAIAQKYSLPLIARYGDIAEIEHDGYFELPSSAERLVARRTGFVDPALGVVFIIEPDDLDELLNSTLCRHPESREINNESLAIRLGIEEDIESGSISIACNIQNNGLYQFVLIGDIPNSERLLIYISTSR